MRKALHTLSLATVLIVVFAPTTEAARRRSVEHPEPAFDVIWTEGGYADATSVEQGEPIRLHIATSVSPFAVRIVNLADPTNAVRTIANLTSSPQNCSGRFTQGCDWDVTATLDVPAGWPSGYYAALFPTAFGERKIIFIVRENNPSSTSPMVLVSPTQTYQAYNDFGGRSLYPSGNPRRANLVSYDRPYQAEDGLGRFDAWEKHLVDWLTAEERRFEVISDVDLEDPTSIARYNVVVIAGHSEYWTPGARVNLENYVRNGGHVAVLSGNTMWWQIRLEDQNRTIAGYKGATHDPAYDSGSPLASTNFFLPPVNNPENRFLGTSFLNGGFVNRLNMDTVEMKPESERTPFTVTDGSHWIFEDTGLVDGSTFGRSVAGLEVDGVVFNCDSRGDVIGPDGSDESPRNYEILATIPAESGWGTLGLLVDPSGGAIFNAATQGWTWGLASDEVVQQITANVLDRFSTGAPLPYRPVQTSILAQDLFNCGQSVAQAGWRGSRPRPNVTQACAYEGSGGLELAGEEVVALARAFAPLGQPRSDVHMRFYLKADDVQQRTEFPMSLLTLRHREGDAVRRAAHIEIDATNGKRLRIARRSATGAFVASTEWVTLADGWHIVEMTWRSPGAITLQVDGGNVITLENPESAQTVNEFVVQFPQGELTTQGRVCVDAIAAGSEKPGSVAPLF